MNDFYVSHEGERSSRIVQDSTLSAITPEKTLVLPGDIQRKLRRIGSRQRVSGNRTTSDRNALLEGLQVQHKRVEVRL